MFFTYAGVLYAYNAQTKMREPLTEGVQSVIRNPEGASEGGPYLYFVADGVAKNTGELVPGAVPGTCQSEEEAPVVVPGALCNLYVRHDGETRLVAVLSGGAGQNARVSPDGRWLAFETSQSLTGYDNRDATTGAPDAEVYLYHAPEDFAGEPSSPTLICASCSPTGARPRGAATEPGDGTYEGPAAYQARYLTDEGRLFFDTSDALVPLDVNGEQDVYEYEPENVPSGSSSACSSATQSGSEVFKPAHPFEVEVGGVEERGEEAAGCVALISSGTSAEESAFLDASETGGEVFFVTTSKLAPQDYDTSPDIYDAHECTSASPCISPPAVQPPPCDTEASCKASPTPQPLIYGTGPSETFSGPGNLVSPPPPAMATKPKPKPTKCKKGDIKNYKGKCVKKSKSKKRKAKKSAHTDRRAK